MARKKKIVEPVVVPEVVEEDEECMWCNGTGLVDCDCCGSPETQDCGDCDGTGRVPKEDE